MDYKFFCFNGIPQYLNVVADRKFGQKAAIGIYNIDFEKLPYVRNDERPLTFEIPKPENYDEMIEIAKILSEDFLHARIDLYNLNGSIIFGETTFFPGSGYMGFIPDNFDKIIGNAFILPSKT